MGHLSLGEYSKPQSYHKAHLFGELVEVKKRLVHKNEKNKPTSEKIAKTRRSSSEPKSRKEIGAAKST